MPMRTGSGTGADRDRLCRRRQGRARRGHVLGPGGRGAVVGRHLGQGDPPLRSGERPGRAFRDAGLCRLARAARPRRAGRLDGQRLLFLRSGDRRSSRRSSSPPTVIRRPASTTARPTARAASGRAPCSRRPARPTEYAARSVGSTPTSPATAWSSGIGSSNGLAFSPDGRTMYFADSQGGYVWAFDFDPATGDIDNRRVFIDFRPTGGFVDGATVDAEGCYWLTLPDRESSCRVRSRRPADAHHHAADRHPDLLRVRRPGPRHPLRHLRPACASSPIRSPARCLPSTSA